MREQIPYQIKKARKNHVCLWCGKIILKGSQYYSRQERNKKLASLLEEKTGFNVNRIKVKTHFWYVDAVSWPFCSLDCLSNFLNSDQYPTEVERRMNEKINSIVERIVDIIAMATALQGTKYRTKEKHNRYIS